MSSGSSSSNSNNHNIHNRISTFQNNNKIIQVPKPEKSKNALLHFVAGGLGGAAGVVCTSPLEVIKTQLQGARSSLLYIGKPKFVPTTFYSLYNLVLRDGTRGLFKGLGPHLVGVAPARAVHFSTYSFTKSALTRFGMDDGPVMYCASAISAGCTVALVTSPIWLVKTRMQLQTSLKNFNQGTYYHNAFHCCLAVIREEGVFGFYKGLGASIIGVSESAFQFVLYEGFKKRIIEEKKKKAHKYPNPNELTTLEYLTAAGVAKLIAAISTYPHEVVRTRLRENVAPGHTPKYTSVLQSLYLITKEEGVRGLFGGAGAHILRVVPNSAIMFLTYEFVVDIWSSMTRALSNK